jgi:anti-sigma B factor antagonist
MNDVAGVEQPSGDSVRFTVSTESDGIGTVVVSGDVDLLTAPHMAAAVQRAQESGKAVLLDLSGVDFLGSAGLSVLVQAARRAGDDHGRFAVLVTSHPVQRAIEVTGLDAALSIFKTADAAADYLKGAQADD